MSSTPGNAGYEVLNSMSIEIPLSLSHWQITHLSRCHSLNQSRLPSRPHLFRSPGKRKPIKQDLMALSITTSIFLILIITTSSSEDSVALWATSFFAKVRDFSYHTNKYRAHHPHNYYHFRFIHTNAVLILIIITTSSSEDSVALLASSSASRRAFISV